MIHSINFNKIQLETTICQKTINKREENNFLYNCVRKETGQMTGNNKMRVPFLYY